MFAYPSFYPLLLLVSLCGMVATTPFPAASHSIAPRFACAELWPGSVTLTGQSTTPFIGCEGLPEQVSFWFQSDGNFVVYNNSHAAVWSSGTGGHNCGGTNNCTMAFQKDGNLVIYYNRQPIWYTSTGANIGYLLQFQSDSPFLYILDKAGNTAWQA